jgi:N-acetylglucosamine-6-phosphate deacetylase
MKRTIIKNSKIIFLNKIIENTLLIENGKIAYIGDCGDKNAEIINGKNLYLSPGFIDIHNHGRCGHDVMESSLSTMKTIGKNQLEHGVTSYLAGLVSTRWEDIVNSVKFIADYCKKPQSKDISQCLGIYSEALFFCMEKKGGHNPKYLVEPSKKYLDPIIELAGDMLKVLALAPELPGAIKAIAKLKKKGVVTAAAHSMATYSQTIDGINQGITLSTHTFNGMRGLHHQETGILGAVLDDKRVVCEVIADGIHLNPVILSLIFKIKSPENIILISDSVAQNGLPNGRYKQFEDTVIVKDGFIRKENGVLSGSCLSLDLAVKNMVKYTDANLCQAVHMASLNPARIIGIEKTKGSIEIGKDADLVLFDKGISVKEAFIMGNRVTVSPYAKARDCVFSQSF